MAIPQEIKVGQVWSHCAQKGKAARIQSVDGQSVVLKDCADASEFSIDQFRLRSYWRLSSREVPVPTPIKDCRRSADNEPSLQHRAKDILKRYADLEQGADESRNEFAIRLGDLHRDSLELLREVANA